MYDVFDSWDELAADPSSSTSTLVGGGSSSSGSNNDTSNDEEASSLSSSSSGNSNNIQSVGRDVISSACLLSASAAIRTKIRSRGGDEVYEWERRFFFYNNYCTTQQYTRCTRKESIQEHNNKHTRYIGIVGAIHNNTRDVYGGR